MKFWVIDASFVLRSLLNSSSQTADFLREIFLQKQKRKAEIYSTLLLPLEIANGLRFTLDDCEAGRKILSDFNRLPVRYFDLKPSQIREVLTLSYQLKTTVYDTSYHFIARLLGGELVTCDRDYFQKAEDLGSIRLIS